MERPQFHDPQPVEPRTTYEWLILMLTEAAPYPKDNPEYQWRMRAASRFATLTANGMDETRAEDEIMAAALAQISKKDAA